MIDTLVGILYDVYKEIFSFTFYIQIRRISTRIIHVVFLSSWINREDKNKVSGQRTYSGINNALFLSSFNNLPALYLIVDVIDSDNNMIGCVLRLYSLDAYICWSIAQHHSSNH